MERARKLANRVTLRRLLNEAKQSRTGAELNSRSSPLLCTPSRYVSSLSPFASNGSVSDLLSRRDVSHHVGYGVGSQIRSISVETLKSSDTFPRRHNSATHEEQTKIYILKHPFSQLGLKHVRE
ncbi:hypothetical protein SLA2020_188530 [Shorea laevis]